MADKNEVTAGGPIGDTAAAIDFLQHIAPEGYWLLSAIDPMKTGTIETRTFEAASAGAAAAWITFWQGKRNLYFSINQPRHAMTVKAEKKDIGHMVALHVDIDPDDPTPQVIAMGADMLATHYETEYDRIYKLLDDYRPAPSLIVFSGGGCQAFWLFDKPIEIEAAADVARLEAYNKKLEAHFKADHCFNIDRVMRLPGTINLPNKKKQAKGRIQQRATVLHADWNCRYTLDKFTPLEKEAPKGKGKKDTGPGDTGANRPNIPRRDPPEWCDRLISNGPDLEGPRAYGGDRSKAVWAVCCSLVRCGYPDDEIAALISDPKNKISGHVLAQPNPITYAPRQVARPREKVGSDFARNDKGRPSASQANLRLGLSLLETNMSYNMFRNQHMIEGPDGLPRRPLGDDELTALYLRMDEEFGLRVPKEFFWDVMKNEGWASSYHPVKMYLDSLKWDGKPRIDKWLCTYAGVPESPYVCAVSAIMLLAGVRRIRQPGCKFDEMLVMISPQGLDKSSGLAALAVNDEWFTDNLPLNGEGKEVIEALAGKWIVEAAELKGMRKGDVEHLKAFMSRQYDRARLSYARLPVEVPRQSIFFGTTNSDAFLRDNTGNRRFWPVRIANVDVAGLRRDRDMLWAEAAQREADGESIRLDPSLYEAAALEQQRREIEDPWMGLFHTLLQDFPTDKIVAHDLWSVLQIPTGMQTQDHNMRLGEVMRSLGWERVRLSFQNHPTWHYAKGTPGQKKAGVKRILVQRNPDHGGIDVGYEGGAVAPTNYGIEIPD